MSSNDIKQQMKQLGMRPNKRLGQHFLVDEDVANRQVQYAEIKDTDTVLEIGPGLGILTRILRERARKVVAVEIDPLAVDYLNENIKGIDVIVGDILKIELPEFNKVVSNIPYKISSPLTFRLLERDFDIAIMMYQHEFAERLVAGQGDPNYSRLSVNAYYKADCEIIERVPRTSFYPEPKVDSSIVRIKPRPAPFQVRDEKHFLRTVKALFMHRRKQIGNSLLLAWDEFSESKRQMQQFISKMPDSRKRVEELTPEEIGQLSNWLFEEKINLGDDSSFKSFHSDRQGKM